MGKPEINDRNDPGGRVRRYMKIWYWHRVLSGRDDVLAEAVAFLLEERMAGMPYAMTADEIALLNATLDWVKS